MLVLTRKQEERIHIGDGITITVLKMRGSSVRLGIEAPSEVPVVRGELLFRDQEAERIRSTGPVESAVPAATEPAHSRQIALREAAWEKDANAVLQRVPRSEAERLRGPLRAMIDQRVRVS